MSWISKGVGGVSGVVSGLLGIGGKPGPQNPFLTPNLDYLKDTKNLDFLKDPAMYKSLLDTKGYDFLKNPASAAPSTARLDSIPGNLKTFANSYQAPGYGNSNSM